jgi:hypothetical protein
VCTLMGRREETFNVISRSTSDEKS